MVQSLPQSGQIGQVFPLRGSQFEGFWCKLLKGSVSSITAGMTEPTSAQDLFKGRHFDQEIIILCVRWYITFKLSFRDLVQMMAERGITRVSH